MGLIRITASQPTGTSKGFSLIELVIVVVIIGIIGAIAIPRMSRGSDGAAVSALTGNLAVMNKAVELYAVEHGGDYPAAVKITTQLLSQTNTHGNNPTGDVGEMVYGPYLRAIPPLPLGDKKGNTGIALNDGDGVGWIYRPARGIIQPNLTDSDGNVDEDLVTNVINETKLIRDDLVEP